MPNDGGMQMFLERAWEETRISNWPVVPINIIKMIGPQK